MKELEFCGIKLKSDSIDHICQICSNLTSFTLRLAKNEQLHPNDVVSLASLANLEKLTINKFDIEQDGPEMTEAFAILGQTERAFPFK